MTVGERLRITSVRRMVAWSLDAARGGERSWPQRGQCRLHRYSPRRSRSIVRSLEVPWYAPDRPMPVRGGSG